MLRTNKQDLPILLVQGLVWHPRHGQSAGFTAQGKVFCLPNTGGITYNAKSHNDRDNRADRAFH